MPDFSVIIITHDTLTALGIKHILYKYFTITPTVCDYLQPAETDNYDLYVTTSDIYVCNLDFFMPRRLKTVIIGEIKSQKPDTMIINRFDDKAMIIEAFNKFINKVEKNTSNTHNELSLREIDVLKLIAGGCLNKEISRPPQHKHKYRTYPQKKHYCKTRNKKRIGLELLCHDEWIC